MQGNRRFRTYATWLVDMICIAASYLIATQIRFGGNDDYGDKTLHYLVMVVMLLFCTAYDFFTDWNDTILLKGYFREFVAVLKFHVAMLLVSILCVFFLQWAYILSRLVIFVFILLSMVLMYLSHLLLKRLFRSSLGQAAATKLLVVAYRDKLDETIAKIHQNPDLNYEVVGGISVDDLKPEDFRGITEKMTQIAFDEVLINTPGLSQEAVRPLLEGFELMGVVCHYNLALPQIGGATSHVGTFGDYIVIDYARTRVSSGKLLLKRLLDIVGGLVGLLLTGIITLFLAPAIKIDSKGPVFFSQTRVGKNGRRFKIYKFRSMYQDAEARLKDLQSQNESKGLMFKMENDPRVTKVGRFIRRTSLDEFPQFLNVLKGDMSLVGTRPPTENEFEEYTEYYRRRLSMTPGLTGMWQVSGRSDIKDFDEVVKLDLQYIDNWSPMLDLKILIQTVGIVLFRKGAK